MPAETLAAPAPAAPSAPAAPPAAPPPKGEIHVTAASIDTGPKAPEPKKGSATERMFQELRKKAKPQFFETPDAPAAQDPKPGEEAPKVDAEAPKVDSGAPKPTTESSQSAEAASKPGEKKNPWKLVDEYKARATKAESELVEVKKVGGDPKRIQEFQTTIEQLRKQNEELETEVRFTNYAKSSEFKTKYQEPYEKAWARAVKELSEIAIADPGTGQERAAGVQDLADIVQLPLGKARAAAEAVFGSFADDVMAYRKEIIGLHEAQETALKEAREGSIKRDKERSEQSQQVAAQTVSQIKEGWEKANAEYLADEKLGAYFKPVDGDQDGNQRLAKGFELVDRAFAENPNDPRLSAEQRAAIVKRHAAVRLRAAAFGRLRAQYGAAQARINELQKELSQYKETEPGTGGSSTTSAPVETKGAAWNRIREGLSKIAAK